MAVCHTNNKTPQASVNPYGNFVKCCWFYNQINHTAMLGWKHSFVFPGCIRKAYTTALEERNKIHSVTLSCRCCQSVPSSCDRQACYVWFTVQTTTRIKKVPFWDLLNWSANKHRSRPPCNNPPVTWEKISSEVCFQFFVLHVFTNEYRLLWEARLCCEHKIKDIMLQPFYLWASVFWEHENIMRVLTAASLSAMGHMCAAVCQGLPSLLQKLPLFWSLNILLGSSLSYTQMKTHRCAVHTCTARHVHRHWDAVLLFFPLMSCKKNPENPLLLTLSLQAPLKRSSVSV